MYRPKEPYILFANVLTLCLPLLIEYRAVLIKYIVFPIEYSAILVENRARPSRDKHTPTRSANVYMYICIDTYVYVYI